MKAPTSFDEALARAAVGLATVGSGTAGGVLLGSTAQVWAPAATGHVPFQILGGLVGFSVGLCWWMRVGRRWLKEDQDEDEMIDVD